MNEDFLYTPHKNQIKVHENKAKYRVVVAGRRFGKSALGLNESLARAFQIKNQIIAKRFNPIDFRKVHGQ